MKTKKPVWDESADDVLTINVWAPESSGPQLPVLVWIYGGAYVSGGADEYKPIAWVDAGLVVVTFNYRVGFEGFARIPGCPDNRGLLDQIAALHWVRDNIAQFGGDPDRITLVGESAGAGSVVSLSVSPLAVGLFRRAVAHSIPATYLTPDTAERIAKSVAQQAGMPYTREALSQTSPASLAVANEQTAPLLLREPNRLRISTTLYSPIIDEVVLSADPATLAWQGASNGADILVCHTTEEFRLFQFIGALIPKISDDADLAGLAADCGLSATALAEYRALYPDDSAADIATLIETDALFAEYSCRFAEAQAAGGGQAHLARFSRRSTAFDGELGAAHATDLPFMFGDLSYSPFGTANELARGDMALAYRISSTIANFAAGHPLYWKPVTVHNTAVKYWDIEDRLFDEDPCRMTRALWAGVPFTPV